MSLKRNTQATLKNGFLISCLILLAVIPLVSGQAISAMMAAFNSNTDYLVSHTMLKVLLGFYVISTSLFLAYQRAFDNVKTHTNCLFAAIIIGFVAMLTMFYCDALYMRFTTEYSHFPGKLMYYFDQEAWLFQILLSYEFSLIFYTVWLVKKSRLVFSCSQIKTLSLLAMILWGSLIGFPFYIINYEYYTDFHNDTFVLFEHGQTWQNSLLFLGLASIFFIVFCLRKTYVSLNAWLIKLTYVLLLFSLCSAFMYVFILMRVDQSLEFQMLWSTFFAQSKTLSFALMPIVALGLLSRILYLQLKGKLGGYTEAGNTSNSFGGAKWATPADLKKQNLFDQTNGPLIGADATGVPLFGKMSNKLTLSPPGGGKTTCSSIPVLLTHDGPTFVLDIKGELFATTAKHRLEVMGRKPIVIDPFGITKTETFSKDLPEALLKTYTINPFDWIPEERCARDRILNAFAASLVINEGGHINHFDENAKILIRGYIDYLMTQPLAKRNLPELFRLCSESMQESEETLQQMMAAGGRAESAANQIGRVGADERGSILSTTYRQIDWLGDANIEKLLQVSNFDLNDFLKGNLDIYVVLPVDQVKEHGRLFRMIMCLLMNVIIQADPKDLPTKEILFLIEEIAQIGPSEDVEQCIEVLRARGVNIWVVFQTLAQIKQFKKPDLFLTMAVKQIFTTDDPDTMEWVQKLGGDRTILTKTLSTNSGGSRQRMQTFGGSVSSGEGESVHETGVKLIALNEISVMPKDEQFVFIESQSPIRAKKIRYFDHALFKGRFSANPLENR